MKSLIDYINESLRSGMTGEHSYRLFVSELDDHGESVIMECPAVANKMNIKNLYVRVFENEGRKDRIVLESEYGKESYLFNSKKPVKTYHGKITPNDLEFDSKQGINRTLGASRNEIDDAAKLICTVINNFPEMI